VNQNNQTDEELTKKKPILSWFPVRYITEIASGQRSDVEWLSQACKFGFTHVEIHFALIRDDQRLEVITSILKENHLGVSMFTCAPDFTNPDRRIRAFQLEDMKEKVDKAQMLGARGIRVTAGMQYPEIDIHQGLEWALEGLLQLADYAEPRGIKLCLENHYKDRTWDKLDFTVDLKIFLELFEQIRSTPIMINYDTSQPMVIDTDEIELLTRVSDKIFNVHAGDRLRRQRPHCVIGEGMVNFDGIFAHLKEKGYSRFISVEDGNPEGDEGLQRGLTYLRTKINQYWGC